MAGHCGVPATARAITYNLTVASPTGPGYLTLYAAGATRPNASG